MTTFLKLLAAAAVLVDLVLIVTGAGTHPQLLVLNEQGGRATINIQSGTTGATSKVYSFSDGLSPACSIDNRPMRSQEMFVISSQVDNDTYLAFAPLRTGVGVQELRSDGSGGEKIERNLRYRADNSFDCVILDILEVDDRVVAPCIASGTLYSCEVVLNHTSLSSSGDIFCRRLLVLGRQFNESDYPYITNFVSTSDSNQVYAVAFRENVFLINFASLTGRPGGNLVDTECKRVQYLEDSFMLYAYCGPTKAVELQVAPGSVGMSLPISHGIPYQCPDSPRVVTATEVLEKIHLRYDGIMRPTNSSNFVDGFCFNDLFFLIDTLQGVLILVPNIATGTLSSLADSARTSTLVLLDEGYVAAIKDELGVYLYNTESLRSSSSPGDSPDPQVTWRGEAAAVGILLGPEPPSTPPPPPPDTTTSSNSLAIGLGVPFSIAGLVVLVVIIVILVAVLYRYIKCKRGKKQLHARDDAIEGRDADAEDVPTDQAQALDEPEPDDTRDDSEGDGASHESSDSDLVQSHPPTEDAPEGGFVSGFENARNNQPPAAAEGSDSGGGQQPSDGRELLNSSSAAQLLPPAAESARFQYIGPPVSRPCPTGSS